MEAARSIKIALVVLGGAVLALPLLLTSLHKSDAAEGGRRVSLENISSALSGAVELEGVVSSGIVEVGNGRIDCQVAASGPGRVSWEIIDRPGVNAEQMQVRVTEDGGVLHVEEEWHGPDRARRPEVRVTVELPESTSLELALGNGNVTTALSGALEVSVGNGNVTLDGSPTGLTAAVGNGNLRGGARPAQGDHKVTVGNGNIELRLLPGSDAKVEASSATGRITAQNVPGQTKKNDWVGSSFTGQLGTGAAALQLEVGNGNVQVQAADK